MAVDPVEVVAEGTATSPGFLDPVSLTAPTVAAFLGRTERGPVNEPIIVHSFDEYRTTFGGHCAFSFVSHAIQHYFLSGGERAVVVRLTNGATRCTIDVPAGELPLRLQARRPGGRELLRVSVDYDGVEDDAERFNLVVQRLHRIDSELIEDQELFPAVSVNSADSRFLVDALKESQLISVLGPLPSRRPAATRAKYPGQPIPYLGMTRCGADGDELTDYDVVGSNEEGTGLFALDRIEQVDLLCIPPAPSRDLGTTLFLAAERYCERRHAMLIWDPPWSWQSSSGALKEIRASGLGSRNAFTYFPRIRQRAEFARFPAGMPASGALAGVLARGDAEKYRGTGAAPTPVLKASFTTALDIGDRQASMLKRFGVNAFVRLPGGHVALQGNVCLTGQDTVSSASQRLDTRRTILRVLSHLERGTRWVGDELGRPGTCARLEGPVRAYLTRLHELGALAGTQPEQSLFVRTALRSGGHGPEVLLRVGLALVRPSQFTIYEFRFREGGRTMRAVPPLDSD